MSEKNRREFLKLAAASAGATAGLGVLPGAIRDALAIPARRVTGTIKDVEHVVILMQENRSFDHYFGTLRGVRGFGDPRPIPLPNGKPVWYQPKTQGADDYVLPFRLDAQATAAQCMDSLDHSWKGSHDRWKHHDAWVATKGEMTMGHFTREDIPFYHALADAFTICDDYHCSIFGPTNPNRLFLFTGTNGLSVGHDGIQAIKNPEEYNGSADIANDGARFAGYTWTTYAERLQAAGVDWRVYQEYDNYGDNALAYFANFRGKTAPSELHRRARSWAKGSNSDNVASSRGEYLVSAFAKDVADNRLPQVSWIVAPYIVCEHPTACPAYGESLVARLIAALAANPAVWAKTVFILNYDENDGFFDHVPPLVPAISREMGISTVDVTGEIYKGVPVGFGPRVPLIVVSPWTKGGWVNSQLFDHTSVVRFLETRFGVAAPEISPWRRALSGNLTSVFDFDTPDPAWAAALPDASGAIARADETCKLGEPALPAQQVLTLQETGQRPARALPYDLHVAGSAGASPNTYRLDFDNRGAVGAGFIVYSAAAGEGPWFYTVEAGKRISDTLPAANDRYDLSVYGPNGFLHRFAGRFDAAGNLEAETRYDATPQSLTLVLRNGGAAPCTVSVANSYSSETPRTHVVAGGTTVEDSWPIAPSDHWYDLAVTSPIDGEFLRRFAGHIETGQPSRSDPAIARA